MSSYPDQHLRQHGLSMRALTLEDAGELQKLYDACVDFALLTDGAPASPTAAHDEFFALPEGRNLSDKFIFGLLNPECQIVGMIEGIRQYPDPETWWLGLMMLAPEMRRHGTGAAMLAWFETLALSNGAQRVMLSVIEANTAGRTFWERAGFQHVRTTEPRPFGNKLNRVDVMQKYLA